MADKTTMTPEQIERQKQITLIAKQNDAFRKLPLVDENRGKWVLTRGIQAEGEAFVFDAIAKVRAFDDFTEDADPYGSHEMGVFEVQGKTVCWKIDLYDPSYLCGSAWPENLGKTRRVLTILFPDEY